MKWTTLLCCLFLGVTAYSQSRISLQVGWTVSRVRAEYDKKMVRPGPFFNSATNLSPWHTWCIGAEYEYDYKNLRLSTGFTTLSLGAGDTPLFPGYPWVIAYWVIPIIGGYHLKLPNDWGLVFEGGAEIGFQHTSPTLITPGAHWGNINLILGVEGEWKCFRIGVRGQLGVTDFRYFHPIMYKHTAVTTYVSYTLWDHAKAKQRRLKRQQAKALSQ